MKQSIVFLVLVSAGSLRADYKWTGKEWVWETDAKDKLSPVDEGSAEYDDTTYDTTYDYRDEKDTGLVGGNLGDVSISNLPTDDEDFGGPDGSGDGDIDPPLYDDRLDGSGDDQGTPNWRSTSTTQSPTIDLDSPFGGIDSGRSREPSVTFDDRNNNNNQDSVYNPFDTKGPVSTESPAIDLDNRGPPVDLGPREPVKPFDYDPTSYDDYPDNYDDKYDDTEYDSPPYDDIPIDEVSSTTTTTTTTTSTTPKPFNRDTPIIQDIPTNRPASFFAQPGILAAVIGGAVVGLLCAILLVMFIVYRMRKKDEGSYILDEPTRTHNGNLYTKTPNKEFYA